MIEIEERGIYVFDIKKEKFIVYRLWSMCEHLSGKCNFL